MAQGKGFRNPYADGVGGQLGPEARRIQNEIKSHSSLSDDDWFFHYLASSKHCPHAVRDPDILKYEKTFNYVMQLKEWVEMMTALETAHSIDDKAELDKIKR